MLEIEANRHMRPVHPCDRCKSIVYGPVPTSGASGSATYYCDNCRAAYSWRRSEWPNVSIQLRVTSDGD